MGKFAGPFSILTASFLILRRQVLWKKVFYLLIKLSKSFPVVFRRLRKKDEGKAAFSPRKVFFFASSFIWSCQFSGLQSNKKASLRKHSFFLDLQQIEINRLSVHSSSKRNKREGKAKKLRKYEFSNLTSDWN